MLMEIFVNEKRKTFSEILIDFFAFQYDVAESFLCFLFDYSIWITSYNKKNAISTLKSNFTFRN
jgi:hypothetical protein